MKYFRNSILLLFFALLILPGCSKKKTPEKSESPEELYKKGLSSYKRKKYSDAIATFYKLKYDYPSDVAATMADLKIADSYYLNKDYGQAAASYEDFRKFHPSSEYIPYVTYQLGMSYFKQKLSIDRDPTFLKKALSEFQYLVTYHPQSPFAYDGYQRLLECQRMLAAHELYVANFYYKKGKYKAAINRFEACFRNHPTIPVKAKMLYILGDAYLQVRELRKSKYVYSTLIKQYPESKYAKKAKNILSKKLSEDRLMLAEKEAREKEIIVAKGPSPPALSRTTGAILEKIERSDVQGEGKTKETEHPEEKVSKEPLKVANIQSQRKDQRVDEVSSSGEVIEEKEDSGQTEGVTEAKSTEESSFFSKVSGFVAKLNPFRIREKKTQVALSGADGAKETKAVKRRLKESAPEGGSPPLIETTEQKKERIEIAYTIDTPVRKDHAFEPDYLVEAPTFKEPDYEKALWVDKPLPNKTQVAVELRESPSRSIFSPLADLINWINPFKKAEQAPSEKPYLFVQDSNFMVDSPKLLSERKTSALSKPSSQEAPPEQKGLIAEKEGHSPRVKSFKGAPLKAKISPKKESPSDQVTAFRAYLKKKKGVEPEGAPLKMAEGRPEYATDELRSTAVSNEKRIPSKKEHHEPLESIDDESKPMLLTRIQKPLLAYSKVSQPAKQYYTLKRPHGLLQRIEEGKKEAILEFLEQWRSSWSEKRLDRYMSFYSPDFYSRGMDKETWRLRKTRLNRLYDYIDIQIDNVELFFYGNHVLARFLQRFRGDSYVDLGIKELWLKDIRGKWHIFKEEWEALDEKQVAANFAMGYEGRRGSPEKPLTGYPSLKETRGSKGFSFIETPMHPRGKNRLAFERDYGKPGNYEGSKILSSKAIKLLTKEEKGKIMDLLFEWKKAWENKRLDRYLSFYSKDFSTNGFDRKDWKRHKKNILLKYFRIKIQIESVDMESYDGGVMVTFLQNFRGDDYQDIGIKRLFLTMSGDTWKISREEWQAL